MGIVALVLAIEIAHIQFYTPAYRIRLQELVCPGIIASAVDNDVLGVRHRPRISSGRLVAVGVSIGINDNAGDMHMTATDLGSDTAPKIFCCDDLDLPAATRSSLDGGATSGKDHG